MPRPKPSLCLLLTALFAVAAAAAQAPAPLARAMLQQLVNINTTDAHGTTAAARVMQQRFLAAGFPPADIHLVGANPNKMNLVVRLRGTGVKPPILLIGHLDVVQARPQDWGTDPFHFTVRNNTYYGRGVQDMKDGDAIFAASLIAMKRQGYHPNRDIILALTAAEEGGGDNGVDYLLQHQRPLIQAAFVLNADAGGVDAFHGKPVFMNVEAAEKLYADFELSLTSPGGHSSLPTGHNIIYDLARALGRLQHYQFPVELNAVTRGYFAARSKLDQGQRARDEKAMLAKHPPAAAIHDLEQIPELNAVLHTTCVATRLNAGDANNALPQNAEATVNCRILPGTSARQVQQTLIRLVADPSVTIRYVNSNGSLQNQAPTAVSNPPVQLDPEIMRPLEQLTAAMWNNIPVVPVMESYATDGKRTVAAGMPTYGLCGIQLDEDNDRAHGRNEDLPIPAFNKGVEFYYRYLKMLTGGA
ncbi:MAG: M20/M25/M40 family metallo-hydrolase [Acidobacteria bacterium]|nr:MAG: M20/M25/M40 family metallo-hydrolase [Acidobacteriota bacterium]